MKLSVQTQSFRLAEAESKIPLFGLLAIFCVGIPGFATIKAILILIFWVRFIIVGRIQFTVFLWLISVICNLLVWYEVALFYGVSTTDLFNQLSRLFLFFIVLSTGWIVAVSCAIDTVKLDRIILCMSTLSAAFKAGILILVLGGSYSLDAIQSALGFETVTDSIGFGLLRLQFPSDIILIFLVACYVGRKNRWADLLLLFGVTVSIFLSFSRFLFVAYVVSLFLRGLWTRKFDLASRASLLISIILIVLFAENIANRFVGAGTSVSDEIRTVQVQALSGVIDQHLLFGTGIGSSVNGFKRSNTLPFSYEVEWYALLMQFGVVGLFWFVSNVVAPLISCIKVAEKRSVFIFVVGLWAFAGFTNPYVTSLGSAFGFCVLMVRCIPDQWRQSLEYDRDENRRCH